MASSPALEMLEAPIAKSQTSISPTLPTSPTSIALKRSSLPSLSTLPSLTSLPSDNPLDRIPSMSSLASRRLSSLPTRLGHSDRSSSPSSLSSASSSIATSPNATTISSLESSFPHSLNLSDTSSILDYRSSDASSGFATPSRRHRTLSVRRLAKQTSQQWYREFKVLETELPKFVSKTGVIKANVLRLALLPFLRQRRSDGPTDASNNRQRITLLQRWWTAILDAFKKGSISGSDRSAYLEGLSGLLARLEWLQNTDIYEQLLTETVQMVMSKLALKTVPLSMAAFAGKVLAYAFFWIPDLAPVLLHLLAVPQSDINRILTVSFSQTELCSLEEARTLYGLADCFPAHLHHLVGCFEGRGAHDSAPPPPTPTHLANIYGPWTRRWASSNSDVFIAFLKHYYSIISSLLPRDLPWNAHLAAPGLLHIQAFILGSLDFAVHSKRLSESPRMDVADAIAVGPIMRAPRRRVDQLKVLIAIREILHNDESCVTFYEQYCCQFERLLHAVALRTSVYDVESCVVFADLVEEYLSSLVLTHSLTKQTVEIQKDKVIDWVFWIQVAQRMLTSENCHTELRALALLFNMWDHIPIGCGQRTTSTLLPNSSSQDLEFCIDESEGLRWNCIMWLLSPAMWKRYFCHWQPLVRAYYQRLVCWRIASVDSDSGLMSSVLYANCTADARIVLLKRLEQTQTRVVTAVQHCKDIGYAPPSLDAAPPVVNRELAISVNPVLNNGVTQVDLPTIGDPQLVGSQHLHRVNPFDVFDDYAYAYPPMASPLDQLFPQRGAASPTHSTRRRSGSTGRDDDYFQSVSSDNASILTTSKKKWGLLRESTHSIKRYFSTGGIRSSSAPSFAKSKSAAQSPELTPRASMHESDGPDSASPRSLKKAGPSLTSLIPPPPQLLRERPEITRSLYKFCLIHSEAIMRRQFELLQRRRNGVTAGNDREIAQLRVTPRLPSPGKRRSLCDGLEKKEALVTVLGLDDSQVVEADSASDLIDFDAYATCDESDGGDNEFDRLSHDQVKYWNYAGRSLSEWAGVVTQFEEFVLSRRALSGVSRLEDLGIPFLVAEIPPRVLAG